MTFNSMVSQIKSPKDQSILVRFLLWVNFMMITTILILIFGLAVFYMLRVLDNRTYEIVGIFLVLILLSNIMSKILIQLIEKMYV